MSSSRCQNSVIASNDLDMGVSENQGPFTWTLSKQDPSHKDRRIRPSFFGAPIYEATLCIVPSKWELALSSYGGYRPHKKPQTRKTTELPVPPGAVCCWRAAMVFEPLILQDPGDSSCIRSTWRCEVPKIMASIQE